MFTDFKSLKLEREMKVLDRQINKLMIIQDTYSKLCDELSWKSEAYELVTKKYWENSAKLKVLFNVADNIQNIIDFDEKGRDD